MLQKTIKPVVVNGKKKYRLVSRTGKSLGVFDTLAQAKERERQIIAAVAAKKKRGKKK